MSRVYSELVHEAVERERAYQIQKWGDLDERNSVADFLLYMKRYYDKAVAANNPDSPNESLTAIRKMTTLGFACMERHGCG